MFENAEIDDEEAVVVEKKKDPKNKQKVKLIINQ